MSIVERLTAIRKKTLDALDLGDADAETIALLIAEEMESEVLIGNDESVTVVLGGVDQDLVRSIINLLRASGYHADDVSDQPFPRTLSRSDLVLTRSIEEVYLRNAEPGETYARTKALKVSLFKVEY